MPQLTLELLKEWTIGFAQADITQKTACLHYISPWLSNLEIFAKPSREDGKQSVKLVAEIMRSLLAVTIAERTVCTFILLGTLFTVGIAAVPIHHGTHMGGYRGIT